MDELSDEVKAILISDIHRLNTALSVVKVKIDALAPRVDEIDTKWLASRKRALSIEFQDVVGEVLRDELLKANTNIQKELAAANQSVEIAARQLEGGFTRMLLLAVVVGACTGVLATVIAGVFLGVF